jgi:predicted O-methyltransferase YrrM
MKTLTTLANKYKSDKGTEYGHKHNFTDIYDEYFINFKNEYINILEIGIQDGCSLKMLYEYFPNATILGLDIDDKTCFNNDRISCAILDQSKKDHLEHLVKDINIEFDIIIDDGSHHISDQQLSFGYLFPLLKSDGLYILEDLHTSLSDPGTVVYGRPMENNLEKDNTTLHYLKNKPYVSIYLDQKQNEYIQNNIKEVLIFERDNLNVPEYYKNKSITSIIKKKERMTKRIEELLETPRMYYYELFPQNSLKGLYDLIQEHITPETKMVEIGSFSGVSSELFALHCKEINCVDRWQEYNEINSPEIIEGERRFDELVVKYSNIKKIKLSSEEASNMFENESLDFIYIDAAHDYENVKKDILCWLPKIKLNGIVAGHDISIDGVSRAVREIFGTSKQYEDTSWLVIKK